MKGLKKGGERESRERKRGCLKIKKGKGKGQVEWDGNGTAGGRKGKCFWLGGSFLFLFFSFGLN